MRGVIIVLGGNYVAMVVEMEVLDLVVKRDMRLA